MTQHRHTIPKGANQTASVTDPDLTPYAKTAQVQAEAANRVAGDNANANMFGLLAARVTPLEASMANVLLRLAAVEKPYTPPAPPPSSVVATLGPSTTSAQLLAKMADMTIDVIELTAGTYSALTNPTYVDGIDRTSRPLTIRPASGATVIIPGGTRPAFYFGLSSKVSYTTMPGLTLSGFNFSATDDGILWTGWVDHLTLNSMIVTNVLGATPYMSWALYISSDCKGHAGTDITANGWTVDASVSGARGIGGLAMGNGPLGPINITANGWTISHAKYAWYMHQDTSAERGSTNCHMDGWTITDCGYNSGVLCAAYYGYMDGTYSNMHATGCGCSLYQEGSPNMTDGGGNSWA